MGAVGLLGELLFRTCASNRSIICSGCRGTLTNFFYNLKVCHQNFMVGATFI